MKSLLLLAALLLAPERQEDGIDVVLVIDASISMTRNDPGKFRTVGARALADQLMDVKGVNVSVVLFAGFDECKKRNVAPLIRTNDREKMIKALQEAPTFGEATDITVAIEQGFPKVMEERAKAGAKGPIWMIVITDDDWDVVEERVRPEYEAIAQRDFPKEFKDQRDLALVHASGFRFAEVMKSQYKDQPILITGVHLGKDPVPADSAFRKVVASSGRPGGIYQHQGNALIDVIAPVLAESPLFRRKSEAFYGHDSGNGSFKKDLRVYAESEEVRVIAWSPSPEYGVKVAGLNAQVLGEGDGYRVLRVQKPAVGTYPIEVTAKADQKVELLYFVRSNLVPTARLVSPAKTALGETVEIEAGLADGAGKSAADPELAKLILGQVSVKTPGATQSLNLEFKESGLAKFRFPIPKDQPGTYSFQFQAAAVLPGGLKDMALGGAVPGEISVQAFSAFVASFDRESAWLGRPVQLRVTAPPGAKQKPDALEIPVQGTGTTSMMAKLDPSGKEWQGTLEAKGAGTWTIGSAERDQFFIAAGKPSAVTVKDRGLRLLQGGKPVQALKLPVKYKEAAEYPLEGRLELDADPDEKPGYAAKFEGVDGVEFKGQDGVLNRLVITGDKVAEDSPGVLKVVGKIGDRAWEAQIPVQFDYVDKGYKIFMQWLPAMIAGLLLLLFAIWWSMLHRFDQHEVRPYLAGNLDKSYKLREWKQGLTGRKAVGAPELKDSFQILIAGLKGLGKPACSANKGRPTIEIAQNGQKLTGPAPLQHCDEIKVAEGNVEQVYYYFDHPPTPDEIKAALKAQEDKDSFYVEE